ncbi:MAG: hypothetical protein Q4B96_03670 [Bacillota bacterium]|nr:hypothetical protein [Bacillota bacterium]
MSNDTPKQEPKAASGKVYKGKEYYGVVPEKSNWVKGGAAVIALLMITLGFALPNYLAVAFGILLILAVLLIKKQVVTNEGIEIRYDMRFTDYTDFWPWSDVTSVHREDQGNKLYVALHFSKGPVTRRFIMKRDTADKVMELAKRRNPAIHIGEAEGTGKTRIRSS